MEAYFIAQNSMKKIGVKDKSVAGVGFEFLVLGQDDWAQIPRMWPEHQNQQVEWIARLRKQDDEDSQRKDASASLAFKPRFERLNEVVHYICIRDFDKQGKERPIRCFIAVNVLIMLGWNGLSEEHVNEWAQRGILSNPLELACSLGLRALRHHQEQLDSVEDSIYIVEEELLLAPEPKQLKRILNLNRRILELKRSLNAHQSVFERLKNIEKPITGDLHEKLMVDMQRLLTNVFQTHEMIEALRAGYQAAVDNRANEVMKVLTLVATIILPVTLLTGFFGMNFEAMPYIHSEHGILSFYVFSAIIIIVVLVYFRKKRWLK